MGLILPAREICEEARRRRIISVIDGAHALAMIPLNVTDIGCDFYTGNCHKWLLAPTGAGFLYPGLGNEDRLQPLQVSWGWHLDRDHLDDRDDFGSTPRLRAFEFEGTRDPCPWLVVPSAIDFQASIGWERIRGRIAELSAYVRQRFSTLDRLRLATPPEPELHGSMTAFWLPRGTDATLLRHRLWEDHRIEAPIIERPDGLLIRVSTHFYNTIDEINRLGKALEGSI
jgi:isopenicillin-N epimerase